MIAPDVLEVDSAANRTKNKEHYDALFGGARLDGILEKVRRVDTFLADAVRTDTSWVAMYHGDFRERLRGARVLELGSGDGLNSLVMATQGAEVVSIDISEAGAEMLRVAAEQLGLSDRIQAIAGDFAEIPFEPGSFDFVVGKAFLHHLTHELEAQYLAKTASVLRDGGHARFSEPAVNSAFLDAMRWVVPVPGRPSVLNRAAFRRYQELDPHPVRDNSSGGYRAHASRFFGSVEIVPLGAIERFHRLLPEGSFNRKFRRFAFRAERGLPSSMRLKLARAQLVICGQPRRT